MNAVQNLLTLLLPLEKFMKEKVFSILRNVLIVARCISLDYWVMGVSTLGLISCWCVLLFKMHHFIYYRTIVVHIHDSLLIFCMFSFFFWMLFFNSYSWKELAIMAPRESAFIFSPMVVMLCMVPVLGLFKLLRMISRNYVKKASMHRLHLVEVVCMSPWIGMRLVFMDFCDLRLPCLY